MGFSKQEHWSGLPVPPPGDLPGPGIELLSPASRALAGSFLTTAALGRHSKARSLLISHIERCLDCFQFLVTVNKSFLHKADVDIV